MKLQPNRGGIVILQGTIQSKGYIKGKIHNAVTLRGSFDKATVIAYRGDYSVTPSTQRQFLPTTNKTLSRSVVVEPIPSNYGLITYDGSVITVS